MTPPAPSHGRMVALLCVAEMLSMAVYATYPALLTALQSEWGLSNTAAGLLGGTYFAGYMLAVPPLVALTDRVDARRVYFAGCLLSAAGALGFALLAGGLWSALFFQAVAGAGLAGTYMPGLKVLTDHIEGPGQSRSVAFYTASFGLGTAFSLVLAGATAALGWRWAFAIAAAGPIAAGLLVLLRTPPHAPPPHPAPLHLLDFRPVFRNRPAMGYILGYAAHCWELFGLRSWMVAFLAYSATLQAGGGANLLGPAAAAAAINLLGIPASILGNEAAVRRGRRKWVMLVMALSALGGATVGFTAALPWVLVLIALGVYFVIIMGDSATLTAGVVAASAHGQRGATMAMHSFLGFGAGFVAPLVFGAILDLAGGNASTLAWGLAFASLGAACGLVVMGGWITRGSIRHGP